MPSFVLWEFPIAHEKVAIYLGDIHFFLSLKCLFSRHLNHFPFRSLLNLKKKDHMFEMGRKERFQSLGDISPSPAQSQSQAICWQLLDKSEKPYCPWMPGSGSWVRREAWACWRLNHVRGRQWKTTASPQLNPRRRAPLWKERDRKGQRNEVIWPRRCRERKLTRGDSFRHHLTNLSLRAVRARFKCINCVTMTMRRLIPPLVYYGNLSGRTWG